MCSHNDSFIGTDGFYVNSLHVLTGLELPTHAFGAFIILTRTPKKMSTVKMNMFLLHCVGAVLDVYLSFITSPVIILPMCAGYPLGLSLILGIPTDVQAYLGISFIGVMGVTILCFFEDRYHRLARGTSNIMSGKRKLYHLFHYFLSMTFILPGYLMIPEQNHGRLVTEQKMPCITSDILSRPGFFVLALDNTIPGLCLTVMIFMMLTQTAFFVFSIIWFLFHTASRSQETSRLQKQFFVAMCIQVFVPLVVLGFPITYIILVIWFDYFNQAGTNIAFVVIAFHGILSTVTMLLVHKPYRSATLTVFHLNSEVSNSNAMWKIKKAVAPIL